MGVTICGVDCKGCPSFPTCVGCEGKSKGCMLACCCRKKGLSFCGECGDGCALKEGALAECNALGMGKVDALYALCGSFVNLPYTLENGECVRLLDDGRVYLGTQIPKGDGRCYGIVVTDGFILVSEYGEGGSDPSLVLYKKRQLTSVDE